MQKILQELCGLMRFRVILSLFLVISYFVFPRYAYEFVFTSYPVGHYLYPFSHVNIWHLSVNILCLLLLRCPLHFFVSYLCCVFCSYLPSMSSEATCGFSGILFAMVGMSWGNVGRFSEMLRKNVWYIVIPFFLPHVNAFLHLYCLLCGYYLGCFRVDNSEYV